MSDTPTTTAAWPDGLNSRVFISNDPGVINACSEAQIYFCGPIDDPKNIFIGPAASDASVQRIATHFEVSADAVRKSSVSSTVGKQLELEPTSVACCSEAHAAA